MGRITELTVTKGRTVKIDEGDEWLKLEYSIKAVIDDEAEVEVAKAHVEGLLDGWLSQSQKTATVKTVKKPRPTADLFPEELRALLSFEEREGFLIIRPRQFLGSENFAKIADIVRAYNGEYVSSGRNSHFKIPLNTK